MTIRELQEFTPALYFYNLKDKAYNHVMLRVFQACEEAEAIRKQVTTVEAFIAWQQTVKDKFKACVGTLPYDSLYPLDARITGRIEEEELTIEKVIFTARDGVYVTGNVYVPRHRETRCPAVLLQCGHSLNGKASEAYQRAARIIAGKGIIVMVQDPPGQGERTYYKEAGDIEARIAGATEEHQQFGNQCFLTGSGPVKYFLADAMRGVDYLCSRPDVDPERIGATGNSGGGTLTALLMLMDERVKAAAPSCWPTSDKEYFVQGSAPDSEQIWPDVLKEHLGHCEIIASMCPKPLLLLAQESDFVPIEGTDKLYKECKRLWKLNGAEEHMQMHIAEGEHGFSESNAKAAAEFFAKYLCKGAAYDAVTADNSLVATGNSLETIGKNPVTLLPEASIYCTESGRVMEDISDSITIFEENLREYQRVLQKRVSKEQRVEVLREKVYYARKPIDSIHVRKLHSICEDGLRADMLLWFTQEMMPCYGVRFQRTEDAESNLTMTVCLWQGGTDSLETHFEQIKSLCASGRQVLVLDVTAMGKCTPNRTLTAREPFGHLATISDKLCKSLFTLGDSMCAMQAFDLIQTIKMVRECFGVSEVEVLTEGNYAILARIAELLDETVRITALDEVKVADVVTNKYYETYDIAHVLLPGLAAYLD